MGDYFVGVGLLLVPVCLFGIRALFGSRDPGVPRSARQGLDDDNQMHYSSTRSARRTSRDCFDDSWSHDSSPCFNVDGTPMMGDIDLHGNPYGVISSDFEHSSMFSDD